ncbi:histone-lysine N-methyltransferase SETMAR [Trichonephila clavipes]|nr:histone-lysine N-methyltransferase SETMAR [Trichonephila clavipes]
MSKINLRFCNGLLCFRLIKTSLKKTAFKNTEGTSRDVERFKRDGVAVVTEWYRHRIVACLVTSSSPVPLKTFRVEQRCTLNLSRAETPSRWCGS